MAVAPYKIMPNLKLAKHTATVIFLHGLGDTGAGWLPVADKLKHELPHVKWLLPNAPTRPITVNMGMSIPGWFDIRSLDFFAEEDPEGMLASARTIDQHIQDEIDTGIPPERIVLGGFSQGGCLSLLTGLAARGREGRFGGQTGWTLGGVVALSSWLPLRNEFPKIVSPNLAKTPVLMCHGTDDPLVLHAWGKKTGEMLTGLGLPTVEEGKLGTVGLSFRSYPSLEHSSCLEEIQDVKQFLMGVLPRD